MTKFILFALLSMGAASMAHAQNSQLVESCYLAFENNQYDVSFGNRLDLCQSMRNQHSLKVLEAATTAGINISDDLLQGILNINGPYSSSCARTFIKNQYDIAFGNRIQICLSANSVAGLEVLNGFTSTGERISDEMLMKILSVKSDYAAACLGSFSRNNYSLAFGDRINLCNRFQTREALEALEQATTSGQPVPDSELSKMSRLGL